MTYNQIEMGDLADAVKQFYNVLPNDMFDKIPLRSKSCVPQHYTLIDRFQSDEDYESEYET